MSRYLELEENRLGRDFIVGDIHGCLDLLKEKLVKAEFNPERDRLISVGDLIDRGQQSLECLELLEFSWFYNVLGNHEEMLLAYLNFRHFSYMDGTTFLTNGGDWVLRLNDEQKAYLVDVAAPKLNERPLVIHVKGARPFNVVHAEVFTGHRTVLGCLTDEELADELVLHQAQQLLTWGRQIHTHEIKRSRELEVFSDRFLDLGGEVVEGLSPTYVGHSICPCPVRYGNHFFLDGGAFASYWADENRPVVGGRRVGALFMYNHTEQRFV